jgi:peptide/nickel transport system substrate-binding protein
LLEEKKSKKLNLIKERRKVMKASKFIRFLRNGLFLILLASLVLILSCAGYTQQEVKAIRNTTSWPCYIDPAVGSDGTSTLVLCNMYDTLVFPNVDGSVKPWLAKSWETSGDGLTYTFELVPGVKFHNGDELTAEDVVFSLQRILTIGQGYGYLFTTSVKEAKALDTYKVQFTLKHPFGPFLGVLVRLYILNKKQVMANLQTGSYGEFEDYGMGWLATNDAGSGPYKLKEMNTMAYLVMEKFNDYWAGWENKDAPQYVKEIGTLQASTVRTLMSLGELEITDDCQSVENLATLGKLPNVDVSSHFEGLVVNIMLNTKKPPTDDIHFRKAMAYLTDYQQILDNFILGSHRSGPVGLATPGSDPNLTLYTLDLVKAEAELKQSRYYGKLDQYPFELGMSADVSDQEKVCLMIQANAAKLGITVNIVKLPWISIVADLAKIETTPNGIIIAASPSYAEAGSLLESRYTSKSCGTWEQGEWLQDPEMDAMIEDAIATVDQKERFQKYYAIQKKLVDLCPTIWLMECAIKRAYRSDYVVYPAADAKLVNPVLGYNMYYRDFKAFPEKAQKPYTPFVP